MIFKKNIWEEMIDNSEIVNATAVVSASRNSIVTKSICVTLQFSCPSLSSKTILAPARVFTYGFPDVHKISKSSTSIPRWMVEDSLHGMLESFIPKDRSLFSILNDEEQVLAVVKTMFE